MAQNELNFTMQHQLENNWCWAAASASVSAFYDPATSWTQCKIVDRGLGQTTCCQNGASSECNKPWYLDRALTIVGHFGHFAGSPEPLATVQGEVDGGRPLGWRVAWRSGGAHFGMLVGYDTQAQTVNVRDPWYGNTADLPYNTFLYNYQGAGDWLQSYFTKA